MNGAPRRIAIVGGGIAGLSAAYEVAQHPHCTPVLFEASTRLGGTVETVERDGFTVECGPDSWVSDRGDARELAEELGLESELIGSNDRVRRNYLARDRELVPMPEGMRMIVPTRWAPILESPLFSWQARLAYLREPKQADALKAAALARGEDEDESVRSFVERHFGREATETIAGPLLAGVFGGDIDTLSAGAVLAPFVQMERDHGSLLAPTMRKAEEERGSGARPRPLFTTLRSGLGTLVDRIAAALPSQSIRLTAPVTAIRRCSEDLWAVASAGKEERFDAVILANPCDATRKLLGSIDREAAELLPAEATSAVVAALCFSAEASARVRVPRGFGFLVPPRAAVSDEPELLAGTFMDQKFPHRAPTGCLFLRGFFGGKHALHLAEREDAEIAAAALDRFGRLLGPLPPPMFAVVRRWPRSLPQYAVGHPQRMRALARRAEAWPRLALTGNAYNGVGLPALVHHARHAARAVCTRLGDELTP